MTRGFITIATGKEQYYKIAANLVLSYRYFTNSPYPFAVIAEEENEYTSLFDDVILTNESSHSFMDKFLLLKLCPYEETIFFDADSLAYGDLNQYWELFDGATDFSALGVNVPLNQKEGVWYNIEDIGEYATKIDYKVRVHAGVCFIRRSQSLTKLYEDCKDIYAHYNRIHFHTCPNSKDECTLGIAMPMNGMKATEENPRMMAAFPCLTHLKADILHGDLQYKLAWLDKTQKGILLHWGTAQTIKPLYRYNVACLHHMIKRGERCSLLQRVWYEKRLCYWVLRGLYSLEYILLGMKRVAKKTLRKLSGKK